MTEPTHIVCPHCDAVNRMPQSRLQDAPTCGKCAQPLFTGRPLDVDSARFAIRSIPTLALFKGGREVARQAGAMDAGRITAWVESHL